MNCNPLFLKIYQAQLYVQLKFQNLFIYNLSLLLVCYLDSIFFLFLNFRRFSCRLNLQKTTDIDSPSVFSNVRCLEINNHYMSAHRNNLCIHSFSSSHFHSHYLISTILLYTSFLILSSNTYWWRLKQTKRIIDSLTHSFRIEIIFQTIHYSSDIFY